MISYFNSGKSTTPTTNLPISEMLRGIKEGQWASKVNAYRDLIEEYGKHSPEDKEHKPMLPGFTVSGTFSKRAIKGLESHSGFIAVDIDGLYDEAEHHKIKSIICKDVFTYACFNSVSNLGIAVIVKIKPEDHKRAFENIRDYYKKKYGIKIDFLADVSRFRFVSYDPDTYINTEARTYIPPSIAIPEFKEEAPVIQPLYMNGSSSDNFYKVNGDLYTGEMLMEFIIERVSLGPHKEGGTPFEDGSRHNHINQVAFFANEYGLPEIFVDAYLEKKYPIWQTEKTNAVSGAYTGRSDKFATKGKPIPKDVIKDLGLLQKVKGFNSQPHSANTQQPKTLDVKTSVLQSKPKPKAQEITFSFTPTYTQPLLYLNGVRVCSVGNIFSIVAHQGVGKSHLCEAVCASFINPECDTFKIDVDLPDEKTLVYMDGERSHDQCKNAFNRIAKRIDIANNPELKDDDRMKRFHYESFIGLPTVAERIEEFKRIITEKKPGLVILDDISCFVDNTNDEKESKVLMDLIVAMSNTHEFGVLMTIHTNPKDVDLKPRGHLGGEVLRKSEAVYGLKRADDDREIRRLTTDFGHFKTRNDKDVNEINFKWSVEQGMFVGCEYHASEGQEESFKALDLERRFISLFEGANETWVSAKDLYKTYTNAFGVTSRTAQRHVKDAMMIEVIEERKEGKRKYYKLITQTNPNDILDNPPNDDYVPF